MPGYDHQPDRAWDEYDWERFLQQQDHKTEKYMELLEKYLDHPQRDQIIAKEMGWTQLLNGEEWSDEVDAMMADEASAAEEAEQQEQDAPTASRTASKITASIALPSRLRSGSTSCSTSSRASRTSPRP